MQRKLLFGRRKNAGQKNTHIRLGKALKTGRFNIDQVIPDMEKVYPDIGLWHE